MHVSCMVEKSIAYRVLLGKPEGNRPFWGPKLRCEYNIKRSMKEMERWVCTEFVWLKIRHQLQLLVIALVTFQVAKKIR